MNVEIYTSTEQDCPVGNVHLDLGNSKVDPPRVEVDAWEGATGTISFKDPAGAATYTSPVQKPCIFQFAPGTSQGIEAGKVHMQFDCASLVNDADPTRSCSSRYGSVLVDRCAGM